MDYINVYKIGHLFWCKQCDYNTSRKSQFNRHLNTEKHQKCLMDYTYDHKKVPKSSLFYCLCGKEYKYRQGLWKHQQKCPNVQQKCPNVQQQNNTLILEKTEINELKILTNLVIDVVKQNQELIQQNQELTTKIVDICKNNNNITNNTINSNNKTFNLNVFLNETCKDAMNIMEFVDSLKLQLTDLESVGKLGYIEGISTIIVNNLKALEINKRPVHCSDLKREIIYIKDENKWEKENNDKKKIRKAIKSVANKNSRLLPEFKAKHPDYKSNSTISEQYSKLIIETIGGIGNNDIKNENKIIRKIAKEVRINKT